MHASVGGYLLVGVFVNFSVIGGAFTVLHVVAASLMLFAVAVLSLFFFENNNNNKTLKSHVVCSCV